MAGYRPREAGTIVRELHSAVRFGERVVTPARGIAVVVLVASITLGASQFTDYRAVQIDSAAYTGVENVAPAPEVGKRSPRSAHGLSVLGIAAAAFFVTVLAIGVNWRLARLLVVLAVAVILISLLVDAREGLREGLAGTTYEGAKATLLGGFWVQLGSAVTLAVTGPLLAAHLRDRRAVRRDRSARRLGNRSVRAGTIEASTAGPGTKGAARGAAGQ